MKPITFISALLLTACVTINIYFPAAAAEKVADQIIEEIQQDKTQKTPVKDEQVTPQSGLSDWQRVVYQAVERVLDIVISPAQAAADLSVDSPQIRQIQARMRSRFPALKPLYQQGWIGIKADGLLRLRRGVPLSQRNKVNRLVAAENKDRELLYQAIANANGHPEWTAQIKQTFAKRWIKHAQSGWWYQSSNGSWKQK